MQTFEKDQNERLSQEQDNTGRNLRLFLKYLRFEQIFLININQKIIIKINLRNKSFPKYSLKEGF